MEQDITPNITPELLEQNPILATVLSAFSLLVILILIGGLLSWVYLGIRWKKGLPVLPVALWQRRVWGLVDVLVVGIVALACQVLFAAAGVNLLALDRGDMAGGHMPLALMTFISLGNVLAVGLGTLWIMLRFNVSPAHLGFGLRALPRHLLVGIVATLAALPIVYLLMAAVSLGFDADYQHPLLDEMKNSGTLVSFLLGVVAAVLVAPLAEEFLFRVVIQGWLQSLPFSTPAAALLGAPQAPLAATVLSEDASLPATASATPPTAEFGAEPADLQDPYAVPADLQDPYAVPADAAGLNQPAYHSVEGPAQEQTASPEQATLRTVPPVWPSVLTGILFGLAHWGYGLSFIPLIVLGIVLGLLYRATQSIWPCVVVHVSLNASSMLAMGVNLMIEATLSK